VQKNRIFVAYDVTDDKARRKIVKLLDRYGVRVQRSVYQMSLTTKKSAELSKDLHELFFKLRSGRHHAEGRALSIIMIPVCGKCRPLIDYLGAANSTEEDVIV
jgi:CRISPR-associated protein Cas2